MFLETSPNVWDNLSLVKRVEMSRVATSETCHWQIELYFEPHEVRIITATSLMACRFVWTTLLRSMQDGIVFIDNEDLREITNSAEQQVKEYESAKGRNSSKTPISNREDTSS